MRKSNYVKTTRKVIIEKTIDLKELFKLTMKFQHSKRCNDKKRRSFFLYFLNDVLILKHKRPFEDDADYGSDRKVYIKNTYLFNGNLHQERSINWNDPEPRLVKYPVSKEKLKALNVPKDLKIILVE